MSRRDRRHGRDALGLRLGREHQRVAGTAACLGALPDLRPGQLLGIEGDDAGVLQVLGNPQPACVDDAPQEKWSRLRRSNHVHGPGENIARRRAVARQRKISTLGLHAISSETRRVSTRIVSSTGECSVAGWTVDQGRPTGGPPLPSGRMVLGRDADRASREQCVGATPITVRVTNVPRLEIRPGRAPAS